MAKQVRSASKSQARGASASKAAPRNQKSAQKPAKKVAPVVKRQIQNLQGNGVLTNLNAGPDATRVVPANRTKKTATHKKQKVVVKVAAAKRSATKAKTTQKAKSVSKRVVKSVSKRTAPRAPKRA